MRPVEGGFIWVCPNNHEVREVVSDDSVVSLRHTLAENRPIELFCNRCAFIHRLTTLQVMNIQLWLDWLH